MECYHTAILLIFGVLQKEYHAKSVSEALFKNHIDDLDALDDPSDYRKWSNLEEEKKELLNELIGGSTID
ncbi:hypothetical protein [Lentibacillus saliphilus]|uniref:hypothetical protein n=1 Tax=Lentibacillus saliphilus TaxID=2737028 RepID=UPI001C30BA9A|nr:hypothetical protein [Lentibacillus saliphilus]